jgi:hypothetical protein
MKDNLKFRRSKSVIMEWKETKKPSPSLSDHKDRWCIATGVGLVQDRFYPFWVPSPQDPSRGFAPGPQTGVNKRGLLDPKVCSLPD